MNIPRNIVDEWKSFRGKTIRNAAGSFNKEQLARRAYDMAVTDCEQQQEVIDTLEESNGDNEHFHGVTDYTVKTAAATARLKEDMYARLLAAYQLNKYRLGVEKPNLGMLKFAVKVGGLARPQHSQANGQDDLKAA